MKIQMNNMLALCFLVTLFVGIVGGIKCLGCSSVGPDNRCKTKSYECTASKWQFCFTRKLSRMHKIVKIDRGCTSFCKSESRLRDAYDLTTFCCFRDHCNSLNVWY